MLNTILIQNLAKVQCIHLRHHPWTTHFHGVTLPQFLHEPIQTGNYAPFSGIARAQPQLKIPCRKESHPLLSLFSSVSMDSPPLTYWPTALCTGNFVQQTWFYYQSNYCRSNPDIAGWRSKVKTNQSRRLCISRIRCSYHGADSAQEARVTASGLGPNLNQTTCKSLIPLLHILTYSFTCPISKFVASKQYDHGSILALNINIQVFIKHCFLHFPVQRYQFCKRHWFLSFRQMFGTVKVGFQVS